jgi:hypothetical protein
MARGALIWPLDSLRSLGAVTRFQTEIEGSRKQRRERKRFAPGHVPERPVRKSGAPVAHWATLCRP